MLAGDDWSVRAGGRKGLVALACASEKLIFDMTPSKCRSRSVPSTAARNGPHHGRSLALGTRTVFYSFHYDRDVHRVQLVRNIGAVDGSPALGSQEWETVRRNSQQAVVNWIDKQMAYKRAVVVLIGQQTANRPWVKYEIEKAWNSKKPLVGVHIHGLSSMGLADTKGANPFDAVAGVTGVPVFDPTKHDYLGRIDTKATYAYLAANLPSWVDQARARA